MSKVGYTKEPPADLVVAKVRAEGGDNVLARYARLQFSIQEHACNWWNLPPCLPAIDRLVHMQTQTVTTSVLAYPVAHIAAASVRTTGVPKQPSPPYMLEWESSE